MQLNLIQVYLKIINHTFSGSYSYLKIFGTIILQPGDKSDPRGIFTYNHIYTIGLGASLSVFAQNFSLNKLNKKKSTLL